MKKTIYLILIFCFIISGCDKVDDPFGKNVGSFFTIDGKGYYVEESFGIKDSSELQLFINSGIWSDTLISPDNSTQRFILLEEFTGQQCTFCPIGTEEIVRLDAQYQDQLIPVAYHAGTFATPKTTGNKYLTDFRLTGGQGDVLLNQFNPTDAYPRGMVSRFGGTSISRNDWASTINVIKNDSPLAELILVNNYDSSQQALRIDIQIKWKQTLPESYNLQILLVEDHIIDWQKDGRITPPDIELYDHRHVVRKLVNGTFGISIPNAVSGETLNLQYITTINGNWNSNNMEAVAFIFNSDVASYEVIQANAAYVK